MIEKLLNRLNELPTSDCRPAATAGTFRPSSSTDRQDAANTAHSRNDDDNGDDDREMLSPKYQGSSRSSIVNRRKRCNNDRAQTASSLDENSLRFGGGAITGGMGKRSPSKSSIVTVVSRGGSRGSGTAIKKNANCEGGDGDKASRTVEQSEKRKLG